MCSNTRTPENNFPSKLTERREACDEEHFEGEASPAMPLHQLSRMPSSFTCPERDHLAYQFCECSKNAKNLPPQTRKAEVCQALKMSRKDTVGLILPATSTLLAAANSAPGKRGTSVTDGKGFRMIAGVQADRYMLKIASFSVAYLG